MTERRAALEALHGRVLADDPTASAELFEAVHRPLWRVLVRTFGGLLEEDAVDLATDAIVEYLGKPNRFQPEKASLFTYLAVIAKGDALNRLRSIAISKGHHQRFVELQDPDGNIQDDATDTRMAAQSILEKYGSQIVENETDIAVLKLMLMGESETDTYAAALGIQNLPQEERKALVKKYRDKIEKRLKRVGEYL